MHWIAPSEKDVTTTTPEKRLLDSAAPFRPDSGLKAPEYSGGRPPGLLRITFLRFAEVRVVAHRTKLEQPSTSGRGAGGEGARKVANRDVAGVCKAATLQEIAAQGGSLNPSRYVGVAPDEAVSDEDFKDQLEGLREELETLNTQGRDLESTMAKNFTDLLEA
jgi:type I restriction-modification system DNA methylase subunit